MAATQADVLSDLKIVCQLRKKQLWSRHPFFFKNTTNCIMLEPSRQKLEIIIMCQIRQLV